MYTMTIPPHSGQESGRWGQEQQIGVKADGTQAKVEAGNRCYRNVYYKDKYTQCATLNLLVLGPWDFEGCREWRAG